MIKPVGNHKNKKNAVLMGGPSGEREVSLRSGNAVLNALKTRGYDAVGVDAGADLINQLTSQKIDIAYNALHGTWGEDGTVQALLETAGIAYTGSSILSSSLTMDKAFTKDLLIHHGLPTPKAQVYFQGDQHQPPDIKLPYVVKPASEGSSLGITICKSEDQFSQALQDAFKHDTKVLVESFVPGRELTVGILVGKHALPIVEIKPNHEFYSYEAKYTAGGSEYFCPADLPAEVANKTSEIALKANRLFDCQGGSRVDFRYNPEDQAIQIIELNTSPGMTELSLLPMAAREAGLSFADLVEVILDHAKRHMRVSW